MNRLCSASVLAFLLSFSAFGANEIGYVETFSLAGDRSEALKELVPGTRDYYYYHCLHYQNTGKRAEYDRMMAQYIKRHGYTGRVKELRNRQALLDYKGNRQGSLEHIRKELGLRFNHRRKLENEKSSDPTRLDPKRISYETLKSNAMRRHKNLHGFEDAALEGLAGAKLDATRRRDLLSRLRRPDIPNLVDLVVADLKTKDSRGFGHHKIHAKMLPGQLDELLRRMPELKNNGNFVRAHLTKLRVNADVDPDRDVAAREAYLDRLRAYVQTLDPVHNSLKANVLYQRLVHDRAKGVYDASRFMSYIKLPRNVSYINRKYYDGQNHKHRVNLGQRFNEVSLPPVGNEEPVVMDYLAHFLAGAADYKAYQPYIREEVLKRVMAEAKILGGAPDPERWASMLTPSEYKALKDRVELDFVPQNKKYFDPDELVRVELNVKNVKDLIVKVFEINTANYYRENRGEVNLAVNLDGLVATREERKAYTEPPLRRTRRAFEFPQLKKRGVYVVEFIGNGRSSRALVQKGRLRFIEQTTPAGHAFSVLDEDNQVVKDASLWIAGRTYEPEKNGEILVPFSTKPGRESVILQQGDFASHATFNHRAESYSLHAGFYVDRESLLKRNQARVLIRPVLRVNELPISLELLEEVKLTIESHDRFGVSSRKEVPGFKLNNTREAAYEFQVPENLAQLQFALTAKVRNVSRNKKEDVSASRSFGLNAIDKQAGVDDLHVTHAGGRYIVEYLGKNGELKNARPVRVELKHRLFRESVHVSLQTDAAGRCDLGVLKDIDWFRLQAAVGRKATWFTARNRAHLPSALHGAAGEVLRVPWVRDLDAAASECSLLDVVSGSYTRDLKKALSVEAGFLVIKGLQPGDYELFIKPLNHAIPVRITAGKKAGHFALSATRFLETPRLAPLSIASVKAADKQIDVQLANATPLTRVHVVASRYLPEVALFGSLSQGLRPGLLVQSRRDPRTLYQSGRKIGDEYRYILDRQYAKKYPGNMLERPGLLLNPWAIRKTDAGRESLEKGTDLMDALAEAAPMAAARFGGKAGGGGVAGGYTNLDFLKSPSVVLANLEPDKDGAVRIDRGQLGDHALVRILAVDPEGAVAHTLSLEDSALATRELRLAAGLDPEKRFAEQKLISPVGKGKPFTIADVTTSDMETLDSLAKVFDLYATLSGNGTLNEFNFVTHWPELDDEEKRKKYSKYACHELSFFICQKDPEFFKQIVQPYVRNKKDKTFMDHWLVGDDLSGYLKPWAYNRLNVVERILLGRRVDGQRKVAARHVKDLADLIPPNIEDYNRRFDTAIQASALDSGDAFAAAKKEMEKKHVVVLEDGLRRSNAVARREVAFTAEAAELSLARKPAAREQQKAKAMNKLASLAQLELADAPSDAEGIAIGGGLFNGRRAARDKARRYFQKLDKTEELVENNYYRLPIEQQLAGLVTANAFWQDYAAHDGKTPFLSRHLALPTRNFTEMMLALAVLDLPFTAGEHKGKAEDAAYSLTAGSDMVVFHQEIREAEVSEEKTPILVSQHFFRADDRYRHENNERFQKYVTEEFLPHVVYGCQVTLTNPNENRQKLSLLLQIPRGAMPVNNGFYTRGGQQSLEAYATKTVEYYFYFPATGDYAHYPVHVAKNEKLIAHARPFVFHVVAKLSKVDKTSWAWLSQNGSEEQVLEYLEANNLNRTRLPEIAWRMHSRPFFEKTMALLDGRHHYDNTLWSYGIHHDTTSAAREFLKHSAYAARVGEYIDTPLLTVDPVARHRYQHMEYAPLVNARTHRVGKERTILNHRFRQQYQRLMKVLSYRAALDDTDELAVSYYLLLQDRIGEGLDWFGRVNVKELPTRLQYDYMKGYVSIYEEDLDQARALAKTYADYPVVKWRKKFVNLQNQLNELEGDAAAAADAEDRDQAQAQLAATEPTLTFEVEAQEIRIAYQNLEACTVNFYPMDIELLFSRNPFIQDQSAQFSLIRPSLSRTLRLAGDGGEHAMKLPEAVANSNVMMEITAGGIRKAQAYYANAMTVQMVENYGQVKVTHKKTRKPLSKVYVKVYGRMKDGRVLFFKDGYTDFRGRFDYVSLNTNEIDNTAKLAVLIMSDEHGAVIREAEPPKR